MKNLLYIIVLLFISCSDEIGNEDNPPKLNEKINDFTLYLDHKDTVFSLERVFLDEDNDNDGFIYSINVSDTGIIAHKIQNLKLYLSIVPGSFGVVKITIKARSKNQTIEDSFNVTVIDNSVAIIEKAKLLFSQKKYAETITVLGTVLEHSSNSIRSEAYAGYSFSLMRQEKLTEAYEFFIRGNDILSSNDLKSGLCFIENIVFNNYERSILIGNEILAENQNFEMAWDNAINHKDVRLALAQAHFAMKNYQSSLLKIQELGKLNGLLINSNQFEEKLLEALKALADELK